MTNCHPRFGGSPNLKLLVAMIATPFCMNALQFWVTDNFIKKQGGTLISWNHFRHLCFSFTPTNPSHSGSYFKHRKRCVCALWGTGCLRCFRVPVQSAAPGCLPDVYGRVRFGAWVLALLQGVAAGCRCQICMAVLALEGGCRCRCRVPLPNNVYVA